MAAGSSAGSVQVNPFGYVHEIVTVLAVRHVEVGSDPTEVESWFPGHAWSLALCAGCGAHVGWRFDAVGEAATPRAFWGLRRAALGDA